MACKSYRPGQTVPRSGQYGIIGPRGGYTGHEVTSVKDEPFPPTPRSGMRYVPVDYTKHRSGR